MYQVHLVSLCARGQRNVPTQIKSTPLKSSSLWNQHLIIAFDEVERKPNSDLWLSRVGCPVHGSRPKTPCKDTKMATPLDFCRGMSRPVNWYRLMLRHVIRHVANMWVCEQAMWARLSAGSFFDFFLFRSFSRRTLRYYVLSALDFGEFKRFDGSIYRNLRELSLFINTTWLWDVNRGNSYILIAFVD